MTKIIYKEVALIQEGCIDSVKSEDFNKLKSIDLKIDLYKKLL